MNQCKYDIVKTLGEGAFGKVYLVNDKRKKKLAYKTLIPNKSSKKFKIKNPIELDIMFRLESPHLLKGVEILPPGICKKEFGIVSEYLSGDTFDDIGNMNFEQRKFIMFDICKAVKCLHDNDYLHLDIKLNNTMYVKEKDKIRTVLIDYGACSYTPYGVDVGIMTNTPRFTYDYTSPEGCISDDYDMYHYTNKNDIWALGITLLEIIAGGSVDFVPDKLTELYENEESEMSFSLFSEFLKKYLSDKKINWFMDYYFFYYAPKDLKKEDKNLLKDLIKNMLKINPNERYNIDQIINHSYFDDVRNTNALFYKSCKFVKEEIIDLKDIDISLLNKISRIVIFCKKFFFDKTSYILFMAVDIYLRTISKIDYFPDLEIISALIAYKYFYWGEYSENNPVDYLSKFTDKENMIYEALGGKIRSERYFHNCNNIEEVKFLYNHFIKPVEKGKFNPNLIDFLKYDGKEFMDEHRISSNKKEVYNFKIQSL
jgi:serine/threonine protein kinase